MDNKNTSLFTEKTYAWVSFPFKLFVTTSECEKGFFVTKVGGKEEKTIKIVLFDHKELFQNGVIIYWKGLNFCYNFVMINSVLLKGISNRTIIFMTFMWDY